MTTSSSGFPAGYALVTVFTNGIPSQSQFVLSLQMHLQASAHYVISAPKLSSSPATVWITVGTSITVIPWELVQAARDETIDPKPQQPGCHPERKRGTSRSQGLTCEILR